MQLREANPIPKTIDVEKRQITFLASNADLDRQDEKILPTAYEKSLPGFMKNPVILAGHKSRLDNGEPSVVGKAVKIWTTKDGLFVTVQFAETELAQDYWQLYRDGFMKAVSVGFIGKKSHSQVEDGETGLVHDEVELLEVSLVAIPANRAALAKSKAAKLAFVEGKKQERFEEQYLNEVRAEYAAQGRDFDVECLEFAEYLLRCDWENGDPFLPPDDSESKNDNEPDYANKFRKDSA